MQCKAKLPLTSTFHRTHSRCTHIASRCAKQCKAKQCKATQSNAKQSNANSNTRGLLAGPRTWVDGTHLGFRVLATSSSLSLLYPCHRDCYVIPMSASLPCPHPRHRHRHRRSLIGSKTNRCAPVLLQCLQTLQCSRVVLQNRLRSPSTISD